MFQFTRITLRSPVICIYIKVYEDRKTPLTAKQKQLPDAELNEHSKAESRARNEEKILPCITVKKS